MQLCPLICGALDLDLVELSGAASHDAGCQDLGSLLWIIFSARSAVIVVLIIGGGSLIICSCWWGYDYHAVAKKGIDLFVSTLQYRFGITLSKYPVWDTIENGTKKTLSRHKAKLNKEKNAVTGDGDRDADQEMSTEEFHKKQNRDKFYDSMVVLLETYLELKKVILSINISVCNR